MLYAAKRAKHRVATHNAHISILNVCQLLVQFSFVQTRVWIPFGSATSGPGRPPPLACTWTTRLLSQWMLVASQ